MRLGHLLLRFEISMGSLHQYLRAFQVSGISSGIAALVLLRPVGHLSASQPLLLHVLLLHMAPRLDLVQSIEELVTRFVATM